MVKHRWSSYKTVMYYTYREQTLWRWCYRMSSLTMIVIALYSFSSSRDLHALLEPLFFIMGTLDLLLLVGYLLTRWKRRQAERLLMALFHEAIPERQP